MFTILGSCAPQVEWEVEKEEKLFMLPAVDMETVYLDSLVVFLYPAVDSIPTEGCYCGLVMLKFSMTLKQKSFNTF